MSDPSVPAAPPALPLFFSRVVGVNPQTDPQLRLDRTTGFGFAAHAQSVPLGLGELETAAQHFPVLFTSGPEPLPVALLGLREGHNLFVTPAAADRAPMWLTDSYIPAYVRAFPFVFVEDPGTKTLFVGMEPDAPCLNSGQGARMFEDGRPTPDLTDAIGFCTAFRESVVAATTFARAVEAAGLLEEEEATITFTAGGSTRIRGFKLVKPEKLAELDDATFLEWRRLGWLSAIYAHIYSAGRWGRLIELSSPRT